VDVVLWAMISIVGIFIAILLVQEFRLMSAIQATDPKLYEHYGRHSLWFGFRKLWFVAAIVLPGGYRKQISDPAVLAMADRYRMAWLLYLSFLGAFLAYVLVST
jgi:hypothetical protein